MEIEEALLTYLDSFLTAKLYPGNRPQESVLPAVTYQRKTGGYQHDLDGASDFAKPAFDIEVFSKDFSQVISITETIRQKMQGFTGTLSGRDIYSITLDDESDSYFPPVDASASGLFSTTLSYRVLHQEN